MQQFVNSLKLLAETVFKIFFLLSLVPQKTIGANTKNIFAASSFLLSENDQLYITFTAKWRLTGPFPKNWLLNSCIKQVGSTRASAEHSFVGLYQTARW